MTDEPRNETRPEAAVEKPAQLQRRNTRWLAGLFAVPVVMVGASFAAVPLYDLFCRVTGYGGTTQVAEAASEVVIDREIRVRFVSSTDRALPWRFGPDQREEVVQVGAPSYITYTATNHGDVPTGGTAVYNVTPAKAGLYFMKVQCFCFQEQILQPGESVEMPVYFFIDPAIASDRNLDDVTTITLSYTFYPNESQALRDAQDAYYRAIETGALEDVSAPEHDVAGLDTAATPVVTAR